MDLSKIVSVSGMPGLYKVLSQRPDGLILASFDGSFKKFVPSRKHMFTPLENITIYTMEDSEELKAVFLEMKKQEESNPPVDPGSDGKTLRAYFEAVLPGHDQDKVYTSDIKKILKWYDQLNQEGLIVEGEEVEESTESEDDSNAEGEKNPAE